MSKLYSECHSGTGLAQTLARLTQQLFDYRAHLICVPILSHSSSLLHIRLGPHCHEWGLVIETQLLQIHSADML